MIKILGVKMVWCVRSEASCGDVVSFEAACRRCACCFHITDLINARKMEHVKIMTLSFCMNGVG